MKKVLIADDSVLNRSILKKILSDEYEVLEATDGNEAIEIIKQNHKALSAVLLDLVMPTADGYEVLSAMKKTVVFSRIPVIICAGSDDAETTENVYTLGAAGFLSKPYNPVLVINSLHNIIRISEMGAIKNTVMNDRLTGLMNGETFFEKAAALIRQNEPETYVLECMDIDNFKAINSLYGVEEGNAILRQMAEEINRMCDRIGGICGHIFGDNFVILYPNNPDADEYISLCRDTLSQTADLNGSISISAGRYVVTDVNMSANAMYDMACIAKNSVKGRYDKKFAYFDGSMLQNMLQNRFITGSMKSALSSGQFEVWLQPQINHANGTLVGAEALVRWRHPEKGLISPGIFIPVFEQNGFIYELDKYVWERVCVLLRKWLDEGKSPVPVSVNISRCEILKEDFTDVLCGLIKRYGIPADMLRLEITESAFSSSTKEIVKTVKKLKELGFTVEIDDFGSGYSSLNTLKDVPADVIKLDMRFLEDSGVSQRAGSIIESVVRMIKWLKMSVLAEGVETRQQANFLKTVGCVYVQGYLYAKPMPVGEYEKFLGSGKKENMTFALKTVDNMDNNAFWDPRSMETLIFNSYVGGASIIEYHNGKIELIRVNDRFKQEFGNAAIGGVSVSQIEPEECMDKENLDIMHENIKQAISTGRESSCEVGITGLDGGAVLYLRCTLRVIAKTNDRFLLYCVVSNVTAQRLAEQKDIEKSTVLEFNLTQNAFVRKQGSLFPAMDISKSVSFDSYILNWARQNICAKDTDKIIELLSRDRLLKAYERGDTGCTADYRAKIKGEMRWCSMSVKLVKYPPDDEVRVIIAHTDINLKKIGELRLIEENRRDPLTGVLNRKAFEQQVNKIIADEPAATHALFMVDLDNFKNVNDVLGHIAGDSVLIKTANGLYSLLRSDDLVGRIGGDEFMVFLKNIPNMDVISRRAQMIIEMMNTVLDKGVTVSGSLGIAISPKDGENFEQLYSCADKAAYSSKQNGKNRYTFFCHEMNNGQSAADAADGKTAMKAWDERTKQIMIENRRLIERQEEDERYRIVIENTHITTLEWNALTGKYTYSPEVLQYKLSEQSGERLFSGNVDMSGIHPDDRALFYGKIIEKALSGEPTQETSVRLELKTGGYRWCRLGAIVFFDKSERILKAIGVITAETAHKNKSDVKLDAIFKYMSAGVMLLEIKKPEIAPLYVSESYFRLENTDSVSVASGNVLKYVHPDDYKRLRDKLFICSVSGAVMEETFRAVHGTKVFWRHMHAVRVPYAETENPVMIAVETDITDVKLREEKICAQQQLMSEVLNEMNIINWYYYPESSHVVLDKTCAEAHGLPCELGGVPESLVESGAVHPDDAQAFYGMYRRLKNGEKTVCAVIRMKNKNGEYIRRKIAYTGIPDEEGKPHCAIGVAKWLENPDEKERG